MTRLLANSPHPKPPATRTDQPPLVAAQDEQDRTSAAGIRKTGKPRRQRFLALLIVPAMVSVLTVLGTSVASADGGLDYSSARCDSRNHTIAMTGVVVPPANGGWVAMQFWVYSYAAGGWANPSQWYTAYRNPNQWYELDYPAITVPPGQYYVVVKYDWAVNGSWVPLPTPATAYTQFQAPWSGGTPSSTCFV